MLCLNHLKFKVMQDYTIVNGTNYPVGTSKDIIDILEKCRLKKTRIILDYGNTIDGLSWGETDETTGYIGRTTGNVKCPILVYNSRSFGGGIILCTSILKIMESKGKKVLYQHEKYCTEETYSTVHAAFYNQ